MLSTLKSGVTLGAAVGTAIGAAVYGGLGLWTCGTPGLLIGLLLAFVFAAISVRYTLRFLQGLEAFEATSAELEASLRRPLP